MTKTTLIIKSKFVKIINKLIIQNQIRLLWKTNGYKQTKARNRKNRDKRMITFKFILTYLSFLLSTLLSRSYLYLFLLRVLVCSPYRVHVIQNNYHTVFHIVRHILDMFQALLNNF